jgi:hypothetical protein
MFMPPTADWVRGNLHDSGAPLLRQLPPTVAGAPTQLRVVGVVTSLTIAVQPAAWNTTGGQPQLGTQVPTRTCIGDFNNDGQVVTGDLLDYIGAWVGGASTAETDGTPGLTVGDLLLFVERWAMGC